VEIVEVRIAVVVIVDVVWPKRVVVVYVVYDSVDLPVVWKVVVLKDVDVAVVVVKVVVAVETVDVGLKTVVVVLNIAGMPISKIPNPMSAFGSPVTFTW